LDEPFTGIDPVTINSIQDVIRGLRASGISILITDHREQETLAITDRSYVVRDGRVLCHGTRDEVLNNSEARKYYFGETSDRSPVAGPHDIRGKSPKKGDPPLRRPRRSA
jgi:lipopolysaccharide export system ATP-binding protein